MSGERPDAGADAGAEPGAADEQQGPPTADFLLHALRAGGLETAIARVAASEASPAAGPGDNILGDLWRAQLTLEDAGGARRVRSLIVKRLPRGSALEEYVRQAGLFETEAAMYARTLPELLRLLRAAFGEAFRPFWPQLVYASLDRTVLVLEDLAAQGFALADRRCGLDLDQSKAVVKHMALLHAASVALHAGSQAAALPYLQSMFRDSTRLYLETYLRGSARSLAAQLRLWPDCAERYAERVAALEDVFWERVTAALARDDAAFNVLNHGDLWVNNVLFRRGGGGGPSDVHGAGVGGGAVATSLDLDVALIDLQNSVWASPALDLLYFLYTSPADEVRREHEDALIQLYHAVLGQALTALGRAERAPLLDDLRADLRRRFALALFPALCELPNMLAPADAYYDISQYFLPEPPPNRAYAAEPYATIVRRLLPMFEACGVL